MTSKYSFSALAIIVLTACGTAFAQPTTGAGEAPENPALSPAAQDKAMSAPPNNGGASSESAAQQESSQMLASDIIGMSVKNGPGEKAQDIGKITDLVLDQSKKTVNVLIGVGGFLGIGSKDVGVPLDKVQLNTGSKVAVVDMTKEQLEKAPAYETLADKQAKEKAQQQKAQGGAPAGGGGGGLGAPASPGGGGMK
ncbi:hypothetical protein CDEF62S_04304 [Castellaniella defragrans]